MTKEGHSPVSNKTHFQQKEEAKKNVKERKKENNRWELKEKKDPMEISRLLVLYYIPRTRSPTTPRVQEPKKSLGRSQGKSPKEERICRKCSRKEISMWWVQSFREETKGKKIKRNVRRRLRRTFLVWSDWRIPPERPSERKKTTKGDGLKDPVHKTKKSHKQQKNPLKRNEKNKNTKNPNK